MNLDALKTCSQCGETKPMSDFPLRAKRERERASCPVKAHCKGCQERYRQAMRDRRRDLTLAPVDREVVATVDAGPLRAWVAPRALWFEDYRAMGRYCGLTGETLARLVKGKTDLVSLDTADLIVTSFGRPDMLRALYPGLYDFDDAVAA